MRCDESGCAAGTVAEACDRRHSAAPPHPLLFPPFAPEAGRSAYRKRPREPTGARATGPETRPAPHPLAFPASAARIDAADAANDRGCGATRPDAGALSRGIRFHPRIRCPFRHSRPKRAATLTGNDRASPPARWPRVPRRAQPRIRCPFRRSRPKVCAARTGNDRANPPAGMPRVPRRAQPRIRRPYRHPLPKSMARMPQTTAAAVRRRHGTRIRCPFRHSRAKRAAAFTGNDSASAPARTRPRSGAAPATIPTNDEGPRETGALRVSQ